MSIIEKVEEARERLISLQIEQDREEAALARGRAELEKLFADTERLDAATAKRRADIRAARAELERVEKQEAAIGQAGQVSQGVEELRAKFLAMAQGHLWFEGTGEDDAILPHQWQAMQFGAVAKRWILGDGIGLGKTREAVGWLDLVRAKKVLIVAEANIVNQFAGEVMVLAPHRTLFNLYKKTPERRHQMLDEILAADEGVVVVNFEIWRRDKDALAKLLGWRLDTLIVDEAHNLKNTSTANFKYVKTIVAADNTCPNCLGHIKGLYDPEKLREVPSRKVPRPCPGCGWRKGDPLRVRHHNKLEEWLSSKSVKNICLATGTPILNEPGDLYSLLHLCDPILFNTRDSFLKSFCTNNYHSQKWEFREGALERLRPLIEGRFIARTAEDAGIVLPEQHVHVIPVDLDKKVYPLQYRTIRQISEAAQIILDSGEAMTIMHLIALITRKRQANVWPGGIVMRDAEGNVIFDAGTEIDESVKLDTAQEYIEEFHAEGHRQVVFSQFTTGLAAFHDRLQAAGLRPVRLDGKTPTKLRERIKRNFYAAHGEEPEWDVVLANYKAGGTGLNFTAATKTHIIDEEWNPGRRDQSYGRTHRIGQTKETEVYVYRIPRTVDTWMANTIRRKEQIIDGFNETMVRDPGVAEEIADFLDAIRRGEML